MKTKKYCLGVRNNSKQSYSLVFNTKHKWMVNMVSLLYRPFVNEVDIAIISDIVIEYNEPPFSNKYLYKKDMKENYFYIWRGWWQRVGKLIYDTWNGEKFSTHFLLDKNEEQCFKSIYKK